MNSPRTKRCISCLQSNGGEGTLTKRTKGSQRGSKQALDGYVWTDEWELPGSPDIECMLINYFPLFTKEWIWTLFQVLRQWESWHQTFQKIPWASQWRRSKRDKYSRRYITKSFKEYNSKLKENKSWDSKEIWCTYQNIPHAWVTEHWEIKHHP